MRETVTYKATKSMQELARQAVAIQDAANPLAVIELIKKIAVHFIFEAPEQPYSGSRAAVQNPVAVAVLNKLNDLAGNQQSQFLAFDACKRLSRGEDVTWLVDDTNHAYLLNCDALTEA